MKANHHIVYSFQSFNDPLFKGLMLRYLVEMPPRQDRFFHVITHEQEQFKISPEERIVIRKQLKEKGIFWYPITYHNGRFLLFKKGFDFFKSFLICLFLKLKFKTKLMIGFLPIAGGYGAIIGRFLNLKLAVYCFEPHSEYMADFGIWDRKSMKFKLLHLFEKIQLHYADYIVVPTSHSQKLIKNSEAKMFTLPISVDTDYYQRRDRARAEIRHKYGWEDKIVLLYTGKFGGIYYSEPQLIDFVVKLFDVNPKYVLLVISAHKGELQKCVDNRNLDSSRFVFQDYVPYEILPDYISSADLGIIAVPPLPSQRYRTPVKTGLYLSCGLPYLVNVGIAEDDSVALANNVGVVIDDFEKMKTPEKVDQRIVDLLSQPGLSDKCRKIAEDSRSIGLAVEVLGQILSNFQKK